MTTRYQLVTLDPAGDFTVQDFRTDDPVAAFEVRGFKPTGRVSGAPLREEIRDQPKFFGLAGPLWGGLKEGEPVVRYESIDAERSLSI